MKLSIVIPVYNSENTLERCLVSVANQTFDDFEAVLIDDGSSDNSGKICNQWSEKDKRFTTIHRKNGGLSEARNTGINLCKSDYITFIDADDAISQETLQCLMEELEMHQEYDMIEYPIFVHFGSSTQYLLSFENKEYRDLLNDYWLECKAYTHAYACNKIYKKNLFEKVRFLEGLKFEDVYTLPFILKECGVIATCHRGLYYYHTNHQGITQTATGNTLKDLLKTHVSIFHEIKSQVRDKVNFVDYYMHIVNIQNDVYERTGEPMLLPSMHINWRLLFKKGLSPQTLLKAIFINLFGLSKLCQLNKTYHKISKCHW